MGDPNNKKKSGVKKIISASIETGLRQSCRTEVPNHWDASRYLDLNKVQVGPEKLPNWYIFHSFDVTQDQKCT